MMSTNLKEDILRAVADSKLLNPDFVPPASVSQSWLYGWICPKCGAVMSPYTAWCFKCSSDAQEIKISYSTTSTGGDYTVAQDKFRCGKCVYQLHCSQDRDEGGKCPKYKRDAPDGGYYGRADVEGEE